MLNLSTYVLIFSIDLLSFLPALIKGDMKRALLPENIKFSHICSRGQVAAVAVSTYLVWPGFESLTLARLHV